MPAERSTIVGRLSGALAAGALAVVILCVSVPLSGQADDPLPRTTPQAVGLRAEALADAAALLQQAVDNHRIAGAVAMLARNGRLAHVSVVGYQDLEARAPMTERTIVRIYSMTKPITAVAVMMLFEQGRFLLDDPVSKYLPEFASTVVREAGGRTRTPARAITVRDLLLHTSGLEHRTSETYRQAQVRSRAIALPQFVRNIVRVPLMEDPGTRFRYSEATTVLGRLVEVWSGQTFDAFLTRASSCLSAWWTPDSTCPTRSDRGWPRSTRRPTAAACDRWKSRRCPSPSGPRCWRERSDSFRPARTFSVSARCCSIAATLDGVSLLKADTVDSMVGNALSDAVLAARGGGVMGWGLGNVNVVMKPEALRYPASRGEYGWDGTAGHDLLERSPREHRDPAADPEFAARPRQSSPAFQDRHPGGGAADDATHQITIPGGAL